MSRFPENGRGRGLLTTCLHNLVFLAAAILLMRACAFGAAEAAMPMAPTRPGNLTAWPGPGSAQVTLSWTVSTPDQGESINRYEYQVRNHTDGTEWSDFVSAGNNLSVVVSAWPGHTPNNKPAAPFANGKEYRFRVRACDDTDCGSNAPPDAPFYVSATTSAKPPPTPTPTPMPTPTPTPTPTSTPPPVRFETAYLGTVHIVVGNDGSGTYGYRRNSYGDLTAGDLPGRLFTGGRPIEPGVITVSSAGQLRLDYAAVDGDQWKDRNGMRYLLVRFRDANGGALGETPLWSANFAKCVSGSRPVCVASVGDLLSVQDGKAVGVDFFDAASEAIMSSPGGIGRILLYTTAATETTASWDALNGQYPDAWFSGGSGRTAATAQVGSNGLELTYAATEPDGEWKYAPDGYRKYRLTLRDRHGAEVAQWNLREALENLSEFQRQCGDTQAARRLCLPYDGDADWRDYAGQVMTLQVEDVTWYAMLEATPGGQAGAALLMFVFGAFVSAIFFRRARAPQREIIIMLVAAVSSCLPAAAGFGDFYWGGTMLAIAVLASGAWYFAAGRK